MYEETTGRYAAAMNDDARPDLAGLCADLAVELDEVSSTVGGETVTYARDDLVFARVDRATLQLRLPVDIAEAALNTPDTALDAHDRGWLRFSPSDAEPHVFDRAEAWFRIAWKHALDD